MVLEEGGRRELVGLGGSGEGGDVKEIEMQDKMEDNLLYEDTPTISSPKN